MYHAFYPVLSQVELFGSKSLYEMLIVYVGSVV